MVDVVWVGFEGQRRWNVLSPVCCVRYRHHHHLGRYHCKNPSSIVYCVILISSVTLPTSDIACYYYAISTIAYVYISSTTWWSDYWLWVGHPIHKMDLLSAQRVVMAIAKDLPTNDAVSGVCVVLVLVQQRNKSKQIKKMQISIKNSERPGSRATIANNICKSWFFRNGDTRGLHNKKKLEKELTAARLLLKKLATSGTTVPNDAARKRICIAVNIIHGTISHALESSEATVEAEIWQIY